MNEVKAEVVKPSPVDSLLVDILSWPRNHGSQGEMEFRQWLRKQLPTDTKVLGEGTLYCELENPSAVSPTTLFSCHIDTCDTTVDPKLRKSLAYDPVMQIITLDSKNTVGSCLGADDGVGVWLMLKMIEEGIPGGYIFHTGEERGGIGCRATLQKHSDILQKYEAAIAFDRPRDNEVITHQGGQRCCSDKFATALANALNKSGHMSYEISSRGVFTDTKVYRGVIAECTNIGVGYQNQHGKDEFLDYDHAERLLAALIDVPWESLPIDRDPTVPDPIYTPPRPVYTPPKGGDLFGFDEWSALKKPKVEPKKSVADAGTEFDHLLGTSYDDIIVFCGDLPEEAADVMVGLMEEIGRLRADVKLYKTLRSVQ